MNETIAKGLRGCLIAVAAVVIMGTAYFAGYVGGSHSIATPVASQPQHAEQDAALPTATLAPTAQPVTRVPTATPALAIPEPTQPSSVFPTPSGQSEASFDLYWEVWGLIERDFYGELPTDEDRLYGAIRGSLLTLDDDHTGFTERDIAEINRKRHERKL